MSVWERGGFEARDEKRGYELHANAGDTTPRPDHVEGELPGICMTDAFNHHVCTSSVGCVFDLLDRIVVEMNGYRTQLLRLLQSLRHAVNRIHRIHHRQRTSDRTDSHRPASYAHSRVLLAIPVIQILQETRSGEVSGREDVCHENEHLFWDARGSLDEGGIREGTSDVFGLTAIDGIRGRTVAEQLAFSASRCLPSNAVVALAASGIERYDDLVMSILAILLRLLFLLLLARSHLVPNFKLLHPITLLNDLSHELMSTDEVWWTLQVTSVEV